MTFLETTPLGEGEHLVVAGETVDLIAEASGHFWQTIWDDPANAALKEARAERNVLLPGDRLTIPPLRPKVAACATGAVHRFRRRGVPSKISFVVRTPGGRVFANVPYQLTLGERVYEGKTDDGGAVERFVSASTTSAMLAVWLGIEGLPEVLTWNLQLGTLRPVDHADGIRQRLRRLGYDCGSGEGALDEATRAAVGMFQRAEGLEVTGEPDDATLAKLREAAGC
jgi:hypothetical protein